MLASHLTRLHRQAPIRYALPPQTPPEHAEAMRNFLALHTRAYDLPHMAGVAQQGGHLQHPLIQELLRGVLGEHDPGALGPLLDVHQDETGMAPYPELSHSSAAAGRDYMLSQGQVAQRSLLSTLAALHGAATGSNMGQLPSPAEIHRRYATRALHGTLLGPLGRPYVVPLLALLRQIAGHPLEVQHTPAISTLNQMMLGSRPSDNNPMPFVPAYDAAHALQEHPDAILGREAGRQRSQIAESLRHIIGNIHEGLQ